MYSPNLNKKYIKFLAALFVIFTILGIVMFNYSDTVVENIRPFSEKFMNDLKNQDFKSAKKDFKGNINLDEFFSNEGVIYTFKEVGFGVESKNNIWINYYVTGLPSETRNVNINFKKTQQYYIADLKISYHINRKDKQNVITFIDEILKGNTTKAYTIVKGMKPEKLNDIKNIIGQYQSINDWKIIEAINKPYTGKNKKPNKTKFYIQTTDKRYTLYFLCKNLNGEHWISSISIKSGCL